MSTFVEIDSVARMRHHLLEAEKWQLAMDRIEALMRPQVVKKIRERTSAGYLPDYMVKEQVYATNSDHTHAKGMRNWHQSQVMLYAQVTMATGMEKLIAALSAAPAIPQQR